MVTRSILGVSRYSEGSLGMVQYMLETSDDGERYASNCMVVLSTARLPLYI